jgi:hypothetical protein
MYEVSRINEFYFFNIYIYIQCLMNCTNINMKSISQNI